MTTDAQGKLEQFVNDLRGRFLTYTRKAYGLIPKMARPRILDIGCGRGWQTVELARLGDGEIVGIDIDKTALDELNLEIQRQGMSNRIQTAQCSLLKIDFPDESFDILWEEGVFHILDAIRSLRKCRRLLKPNGFLIMHETLTWFQTSLEALPAFGFKVVDHFDLPTGIWWTDYYEPLEKRIAELNMRQLSSGELEVLRRYKREINMVKKNPAEFDCGFMIAQKEPASPHRYTG